MKKTKEKKDHIVKRQGHTEPYDEKKVYGSVYWAAKGTGYHMTEQYAEKIASATVKAVNTWIEKRDTVNSQDIFSFVSEYLKQHDEHTAYMYATLRDIS